MNTKRKLLALLICVPVFSHAQAFKCTQPDGSTTFQDHECAAGAKASEITLVTNTAGSKTLKPGQSTTVAAGQSVYVQKNAKIQGVDGSITDIGGNKGSTKVAPGTVVSVPKDATGPADNVITATDAPKAADNKPGPDLYQADLDRKKALAAAAAAQRQKARATECANARRLNTIFHGSGRVAYVDANGNRVFYTDADRANTQRIVDSCQ